MKKILLAVYLFFILFSLSAFAQGDKFQPVDIYSPAYTYLISGNNISISGNTNLTGNLFSNSGIDLSGNSTITGDLSAVGTVSGKGSSTITGTTQQGVPASPLPSLPDPSYFYNLADQRVLPKNTHKLSGEINQIIYVGGEVMVEGVLSGTGTIVATGNIKVVSAQNGENSKISLISYKDISLTGNFDLTGLFSAAGSIKVSSNGKVAGSLVADSVKVSGNATLTYKPLLAENLLVSMEAFFNQGDWEGLCACAETLMNYGHFITSYLVAVFQNNEKDPIFRKIIAEIIAETNDPFANASLVDVLNNLAEHPYIRGEAAITLGQIGGAGVYEVLISALSDEDAGVRSMVASGLGCLKDKRATQPLMDLISRESSHLVKCRAIRSLGDINNREAEPFFINLLSDPLIQRAVIMVLGEWKSQGAVPSLIQIAKEQNNKNRVSAIENLGKIGGEGAVNVLIELLQDESLDTIIDAAEALAIIGDQRAVNPLVSVIEKIDEPITLKYLKQAYKRLTGQEYQE